MTPLIIAPVVGVLVGSAVLAFGAEKSTARLRAMRGAHRPVVLVSRIRAAGRVWLSRPQQDEVAAGLEVLVTHVAALVRSGLPPARAWAAVDWVRVDHHGIPRAGDLARLVTGERSGPGQRLRRSARRRAEQSARQAEAIVAACRLAGQVGAPLASVLESIVVTLVAAAEAEAEREAALAGPQATARVLLWLPLVGAGLGMMLGADPLGLLLRGGVACMVPLAGVALMLVGRTWSARLVERARVAGSAP
jgi:tight adherence protein B